VIARFATAPDAIQPVEPPGRGRGERGTAFVTALVLLFAFTAGGVIWLSRDVNRRVSNRSAAQSIAFQAARSGAQQVSVGDLRGSSPPAVIIDEPAARQQAARVASQLFDAFGVVGSIDRVTVAADTVTVQLTITDAAGDVTGIGSARAEAGP
jgi:Tfp pilus assembly protein PilX